MTEYLNTSNAKMPEGVRVLIDTVDAQQKPIKEYGYITRRINAHLYEVWVEDKNTTYLLQPQEFTEMSLRDN